jgi:hypothetical protein
MYTLVLGAVFRNEADNMVEFIEHYFFHGVEHLYLCNDASVDNYQEVLEPYIQKGVVTLLHTQEPRRSGRQARIYNSLLLPHLQESQWWLIADLDEFVYAPQEVDLRKVLDTYIHCSQVSVEWLMFGSDGAQTQPPLLVPYFLKRCPHGLSYKSFVQTQYLRQFDIHRHELLPQAPPEELLKVDPATGRAPMIMNHYRQQSFERWTKRVSTRGDVNLLQSATFSTDIFFQHNYNDVYDDRLFLQNVPILEKIRHLKNKYTYI